MRRWLPLKRLQKVDVKTCIVIVLCLIAIIQFIACFGVFDYEYIPRDEIERKLYLHASPNVRKSSKADCRYENVYQKVFPDDWEIKKSVNDFVPQGIANGSYTPTDCLPLISVALLVTYRKRQNQLDIFVPFIHNFLRKQNIHYKLYVIEQQDDKLFNKGLLYNIGVQYAMADKFPCLIMHDVDLLPLNSANLYSCLHQPRHMSASIDKFRFNLPYKTLTGGVLSIRTDQYTKINGFSNKFLGWGGEDDEFALRITKHGLNILRFPPDISRYTMLVHKQEKKNVARHQMLVNPNPEKDGLNAMPFHITTQHTHRLFALIKVQT
ncbi:unnamed protein product [Leptosia nina]|uniref:Beta-1,4-N-acetylgalactosaminyltransferase n=1 Tax=Leptosia nina TaxID=320188 RepID=A0AAV1JFS0_9NEOP